jgi:hypothetical protein
MKSMACRTKVAGREEFLQRNVESAHNIRGNDEIIRIAKNYL